MEAYDWHIQYWIFSRELTSLFLLLVKPQPPWNRRSIDKIMIVKNQITIWALLWSHCRAASVEWIRNFNVPRSDKFLGKLLRKSLKHLGLCKGFKSKVKTLTSVVVLSRTFVIALNHFFGTRSVQYNTYNRIGISNCITYMRFSRMKFWFSAISRVTSTEQK